MAFFQSLVFVSIGMLVAETEKLGKLRISSGSIIAAALMYLTKIATSLIGGGQYFSKMSPRTHTDITAVLKVPVMSDWTYR